MTVPRLILIVTVLVLMLYIVGLALARRNQGDKADPDTGLIGAIGALVATGDAVPEKDVTPQMGPDRTIRVAPNVPGATITIAKNRNKKVRRLVLRLPLNTPRQWIIVFRPARSEQDEVRMPGEQVLFKGSSTWPEDGKRIVPVGPGGGVVTIQRAGPDPSALVIQLK